VLIYATTNKSQNGRGGGGGGVLEKIDEDTKYTVPAISIFL
jgi:hypothetical protein